MKKTPQRKKAQSANNRKVRKSNGNHTLVTKFDSKIQYLTTRLRDADGWSKIGPTLDLSELDEHARQAVIRAAKLLSGFVNGNINESTYKLGVPPSKDVKDKPTDDTTADKSSSVETSLGEGVPATDESVEVVKATELRAV